MTDNSKAIFNKLDKIPSAPNFVRYNFEELYKTLKAYISFAKGMPTVSYIQGIKIISDLVLGHNSSIEQAIDAANRLPESPSKPHVVELVSAFCIYAEERQYDAKPAFSDFESTFHIGRKLYVPAKPTLVALENGKLKPVFIFGWKTVPLNTFQRRLLMTILEDAIFSLTDFIESDAEIIFFPEVEVHSQGKLRKPEIWNRGDYNLLSDSELMNQMELFLSAREQAYPIIKDWIASKKAPANDDKTKPENTDQQDLFNTTYKST